MQVSARMSRALVGLTAVALVGAGCGGLSVPTPTPAGALGGVSGRPTGVAGSTGAAPTTGAGPVGAVQAGAPTPTAGVVTIGGGSAPPTAAQAQGGAPNPSAVPPTGAAPPTGAPAGAAPAGQAGAVATIAQQVAGDAGAASASQTPGAIAVTPQVVTVQGSPVVSIAGAATAPAGSTPVPGQTAAAQSVAGGPTPVVISSTPVGGGVTAPVAQASGRSPLFGVSTWNSQFPVDVGERGKMAAMGPGLTQVLVHWELVEPEEAYNDRYANQNTFDSSLIAPVDAAVKSMVEGGFQVVLLIADPPEWAAVAKNTQGPLKPEKIDKYASFAARLAGRYSAAPYNVRHLVLWPEPDHRGSIPSGCENRLLPNHRAWGDAPAQFATMLQKTYPVVKQRAPNVSVVMGALAYDNFGGTNKPTFNSGDCGGFNFTFLDDVLANGGGSYFDVFAFDAYGVFAVGWEQQSQAAGAFDVAAKTNYLRAKFPAIAAKPMMVLESGTWSDASVAVPVRQADGSVGSVAPNDDWQGGYAAKMFARGISVGLQSVVWYGIKDAPGDVQRGLLDQSGNPKRAYQAYRQAVDRLSGASFESRLAPRQTASGTVEGYVFKRPGGGRLVVAWAVGDLNAKARATIDMPGGNFSAVSYTGDRRTDFQAQGDQVTIDLTHAPVYLISG
jgi:hypothetical protein